MQLNLTTDYAIRILLYLAINGQNARDQFLMEGQIALSMGIPPKLVSIVCGKLRKSGLVKSGQGKLGGYQLAKAPESISLLEVVLCMEGKLAINRCLEEDEYCSRFATRTCPVRSFYVRLQGMIEKEMAARTLRHMMEEIQLDSDPKEG